LVTTAPRPWGREDRGMLWLRGWASRALILGTVVGSGVGAVGVAMGVPFWWAAGASCVLAAWAGLVLLRR
jgi:hypothetical protein